ncbi:hypothetical protein [Histidinibacterium lentulum]|uniref:Uncharacterized protein n=1 Tax=Histidinibacterium lentulum TaxID=2480588 RepID=A0A3N2R6H3_9RHOB|nr:hypothetical protein [Histidinibacterium lentulum]ROU03007.1 hypothetical protein EAT49_06840 [Histidinibacterium lentulum]
MLTVRLLTLGALAALPAAPQAAAQAFGLPEGCEGVLTVQHRSCLVTNVWTCAGDAEGLQWVALFDEEGPIQVKQVDAEFQWLTTWYFSPSQVRTMETPSPDPASLSELFGTGFDTYDFTVVPDDGSVPLRYEGFDRITGETVIDGEPLATTSFGFSVTDPEGRVLYSLEGRQFVSERHRMFFLGESWDPANMARAEDASPVAFIYPEEEGFMAAEPRYECQAILSSLETQP